jgi:hypothetical protein
MGKMSPAGYTFKKTGFCSSAGIGFCIYRINRFGTEGCVLRLNHLVIGGRIYAFIVRK